MQGFFSVMRRWFAGGTADTPTPPEGARRTPWHVRPVIRTNADGQPVAGGAFQFHNLHARAGGCLRFRNLHGHATGTQES